MNQNRSIFIAYTITVLLWASAFPAIKIGLKSYSPEHVALLRLLFGAASLICFAVIMRIKPPQWRDVPIILLLGCLGFAVYHTALSIGSQTVAAGSASLLVSTTPIFSAILAARWLKERFSRKGWVGSAASFIGVMFITFDSGESVRFFDIGALIILMGALGESVYFVFQKKYLMKYGFLPFTLYTIIAGSLWMLFFAPGLWMSIQTADISHTMVVVYLGLFPTVVPYFAIAYVTMKTGASEATIILYVTPVLTLVLSWLWLHEIPGYVSVVGGILTLTGVLFATSDMHKGDRKKPSKKTSVTP